MRFACLGSGSKGNAWLVERGATRVLLDCGFGLREMAARLIRLGIEPVAVTALLITHEHSDHARGAVRFAAQYGCDVWLTPGSGMVLESKGGLPDLPHPGLCESQRHQDVLGLVYRRQA